jgi:hypothetical protein
LLSGQPGWIILTAETANTKVSFHAIYTPTTPPLPTPRTTANSIIIVFAAKNHTQVHLKTPTRRFPKKIRVIASRPVGTDSSSNKDKKRQEEQQEEQQALLWLVRLKVTTTTVYGGGSWVGVHGVDW